MGNNFWHKTGAKVLFSLICLMSSAAHANGSCGPGLKISLVPAKAPPSEVAGIIKRLEARVAQVYPTSGFANKAELMAAVNASSPEYKRAAAMLEGEKFEVIAAAPPSARRGILRRLKGLYSSHVTDSSMGAMLSDKNVIEAAYLREDVTAYRAYSPTTKPIYVFLAPKPDSGLKRPRAIWNYGPDRWILKMKKVAPRLTLCVGDSLNHLASAYTAEPWILEHSSWSTHFIPWSQRELFIPMLGQALLKDYIGLPVQPFLMTGREVRNTTGAQDLKPKALDRIITGEKISAWSPNWNLLNPIEGPLGKFKLDDGWDLDYIEGHVWGSASVGETFEEGDIEAFEFTVAPPTGEDLQDLLDNHIPIRDGRVWPPKPWTPPPPRVVRQLSLADVLRPQTQGIEVLDFLSQSNSLIKSMLAGSTQTWEGYTVEQHSLMVYGRFAVEFPKYKFTVPEGIRLRPTLMFAIGLHDTFKSVDKIGYHKEMVKLLGETFELHGFSAAEIRLAKAIVGNDIIGKLLTGELLEEYAEAQLIQNAALSGIPLVDYLRLQLFFYTIDASSYPILRDEVFTTQPDGRLLPDRAIYADFYKLMEKLGVKI